jgi:flagellar hook-associated protein 3 FlgL
MRISSAWAQQSAIDGINERQSRVADAQEAISSGRRVNRPSDDPSAAAEAERLRSREARIGAEQRAIGYARQMLSSADTAMSDATGLLQSARDTLLQAANPVLSASDRGNLAVALQQMRDQLIATANRGDASSGFVFGGRGTPVAPFAADGSAYVAQPGTLAVGQDQPSEVSLDGRSVFTDMPAPGGPENIFSRLDAVAAALKNPATTAAAAGALARGGIDSIDRALDRVSQTRTVVGERLKALDVHEQSLESGRIDLASRLSDLVDVDFARALSDFNQNQTAADAAMKAYAQVSRLSLFTYL